MAIDINDLNAIRKLTLEDLKNDTFERDDEEAFEWLDKARKETVERHHKKDGSVSVGKRTIQSIRSEYLQRYLNYQPKSKSSKQKQLDEDKMFEEMRKKFQARKKK